MNTGPRIINPAIDRQAAEWFGRREVGLTPDEEQEFQKWLSADCRHAEHYSQFDEIWKNLDRIKKLRSFQSVPVVERRPVFKIRRVWLPTVLATAAAIAIVFIQWPRPNPRLVQYTIASEAGGMKKLELPDASTVWLNGDTVVSANFTADERRVDLRRGEAFFTVAKDPARPFIVSAAGVSVRAVGTAFNVALTSSRLEVLVTEGKVRLEDAARGQSVLPKSGQNEQPPLLGAGQKATLALPTATLAMPTATVVAISSPEAKEALAWQVKLLEFDMQPLSEVVAQFNRYNRHQLVIESPSLARRTFGGTFRADNCEVLVELLEARFDVIAERSGDKTILRLRR